MSDDFPDRLAREVPGWVEADVITADQAEAILDRYEREAGAARPAAGTDRVGSLLYATAAILLGAAAIALVAVGLDPEPQAPYHFSFGAVLVLAGVLLHLAASERALLVDALLAAGMVPLAVGTFDPDVGTGAALAFGLPAMALPLGYLVWRRERPFLPTLSVLGFTAASGGVAMSTIDTDPDTAFAWFALQALLLLALVGIDRGLRKRDSGAPVVLGVLALGGSMVPFLFETLDVGSSETVELVLGGLLVSLLAAGVVLKHRGLVLGAAVGLGIDAIVFAFDVGGVALGSGLLVALAAALIWQAEMLQDWIPDAS